MKSILKRAMWASAALRTRLGERVMRGFMTLKWALAHLALSAHPARSAPPAPPAEVIDAWLSGPHSSCDDPLDFGDERRLTFELPRPALVAAPSRGGALLIDIAPRLVVVRPRDPEGWARGEAVSLSIVLEGEQSLHCRLAPRATEPRARRVERVRVSPLAPHLATRRAALELLRGLLDEAATAPDELDHALPTAELSRAARELRGRWERLGALRAFGARELTLTPLPPLRAQEGLIYLTAERLARSDGEVWLRATLESRSQPAFTLKRLELRPHAPQLRPLTLEVWPAEVTARPGEGPQPFSARIPLTHALGAHISAIASDGREVSLSLPESLP